MNTRLQKWIDAASAEELTLLAAMSATSVPYLKDLVNLRRIASAAKARHIELAAEKLRKKNSGLPPLLRGDLCPACRRCEYARACGK
jgi:hypothetical protein